MTFTPSLLIKSGPKPQRGHRKQQYLRFYLRLKIRHACGHGTATAHTHWRMRWNQETAHLGYTLYIATIMGHLQRLKVPDNLHIASLLISKHLPLLSPFFFLFFYYFTTCDISPLLFLGHLPANGAWLGFWPAKHLAAVDPKDGAS